MLRVVAVVYLDPAEAELFKSESNKLGEVCCVFPLFLNNCWTPWTLASLAQWDKTNCSVLNLLLRGQIGVRSDLWQGAALVFLRLQWSIKGLSLCKS